MRALARTARWTTAVATTAALLALAGGPAAATTPVPGVEATVAVGRGDVVPVVSPDGTTVYVTVADANNRIAVRAVDTQTGQVTGQDSTGNHNWSSITALSPDGSRLYVLNLDVVTVWDTASLTVLASLPVPDQPRPERWTEGKLNELALSPDGATLYVTQDGSSGIRSRGDGRVLRFDTARLAFTDAVPVPAMNVNGLAVGADGRDVYVGANVGVVHLDTSGAVPSVVGRIPATATVYGHELALTPDGGRLLAVNASGSGAADVVDTATDTVAAHLALTNGYANLHFPRAGADSTRFYVTTGTSTIRGSVLALDAATGAAVPQESLIGLTDGAISGLALGPDGHTFYVGGYTGSTAVLRIVRH
ncbi:hypothetical protein [Kitasatospora sp. NBC_01300]|uniref:hypothetical protein n=1 Tax=Kitasatospora sp. NBC_01300 TaxID=2903574 RepID=UPI00352E256F|nr:hypothetical protein OG556_08740 [Kitasatospora sp. NBC_01300]